MAIVTVRVDEKLKKKMKRYSDVNWSDLIRRALEDRIGIEDKLRIKNKASVREANLIIDRIYKEVAEKYGDIEYDSSETIRTWRDSRYSYRTHQS